MGRFISSFWFNHNNKSIFVMIIILIMMTWGIIKYNSNLALSAEDSSLIDHSWSFIRRYFYPITDFGDSLSLLETNQAFDIDFSFSVFKPPTICSVVRRYRQYVHLDDILFKRYCIVELISFPI